MRRSKADVERYIASVQGSAATPREVSGPGEAGGPRRAASWFVAALAHSVEAPAGGCDLGAGGGGRWRPRFLFLLACSRRPCLAVCPVRGRTAALAPLLLGLGAFVSGGFYRSWTLPRGGGGGQGRAEWSSSGGHLLSRRGTGRGFPRTREVAATLQLPDGADSTASVPVTRRLSPCVYNDSAPISQHSPTPSTLEASFVCFFILLTESCEFYISYRALFTVP